MYEDILQQTIEVGGELEHHQRRGAHWGEHNGPPYPLDRKTIQKKYSDEPTVYKTTPKSSNSNEKKPEKKTFTQKAAKVVSGVSVAKNFLTTIPAQVSNAKEGISNAASKISKETVSSMNKYSSSALKDAYSAKEKKKAEKAEKEKYEETLKKKQEEYAKFKERQDQADEWNKKLSEDAAKRASKLASEEEELKVNSMSDRQKKLQSMSAKEILEHASEYTDEEIRSTFSHLDTMATLQQKSINEAKNELQLKQQQRDQFYDKMYSAYRMADTAVHYGEMAIKIYDTLAVLSGSPTLEQAGAQKVAAAVNNIGRTKPNTTKPTGSTSGGDGGNKGQGGNDQNKGKTGNDQNKGQGSNEQNKGQTGNDQNKGQGSNDQNKGQTGNDQNKGQTSNDQNKKQQQQQPSTTGTAATVSKWKQALKEINGSLTSFGIDPNSTVDDLKKK